MTVLRSHEYSDTLSLGFKAVEGSHPGRAEPAVDVAACIYLRLIAIRACAQSIHSTG